MNRVICTWLFFFLHCSNPAIHRYLIYETSAGTKTLKTGLELQQMPLIVFEVAKAEELDHLAESLGIAVDQRYYRLPPISIFRFRLQNNTTSTYTFDFSDCAFYDDLGKYFTVIDRHSYESRFTSSAYQRFPYNSLFSFYFTRHPDKKKKEFGPYPARILAGEAIEMPPDSQGEIYVPFEFLSTGSRMLWLKCPTLKLEQSFYYRTLRADREKEKTNH